MKSSFAEKFDNFTRFMFNSREGSGRRQAPMQRSLMAFFRTGKGSALQSMCSFDPLTIIYMFLYRFVLMGSGEQKCHKPSSDGVTQQVRWLSL